MDTYVYVKLLLPPRHSRGISHLISREVARNPGKRGYRAKQACEMALQRSELSRNARRVEPWVLAQADAWLTLPAM
jgi:hypothetical protein